MTVRTVETIDTHTLGEPTRIVLDGFPELRGRTMKDRSRDLLRRHGAMRRALMWEPRGHHVMFGAVVVPPAVPGADLASSSWTAAAPSRCACTERWAPSRRWSRPGA